ncbi:MAG: YfhO family protein [Deltaproteobacteria bacterium]|nr:YfhO family protein [Deltaproteobacteria bacterium]MBI3391528.1 YfhO family protein [Deltaproteobacteria bacterium]
MERHTRAALLAGASLLGWSLWCWWRLLAPIQFRSLSIINLDLYNEVVPRLEFAIRSLRAGHLPLWNPYQACGTPFLAIQQHGLFYPLNLPHILLPIGVALSAVAVIHYVIAFWSTFLLARDLGLSVVAAVIGGATFSLGGDMVWRFFGPPHLYAITWLPLQLFLIRRLWRGERLAHSATLLAIVSALQYVGGYPQYSLYAAYMMGSYILCCVITERDFMMMRAIAVLGATTLAAGLSAVQLFPSMELMLDSPRRLGTLSNSFLADVIPPWDVVEGILLHSRPLSGWGRAASIGIGPLLLAITGWRHLPRSDRLFLLALLIGALVFGAVEFPGRLEILSYVPGATWFRQPFRVLVLASLALSLFAAAGADQLLAEISTTAVLRALAPALAVVVAAAAAFVVRGMNPWQQYWRLAWIGAVPAAIIASRWRPATRAALLTIAVASELVLMHQNFMVVPHVEPDFLPHPAQAIDYLHRYQGQWRTYVAQTPSSFANPIRQPPIKLGMSAELYTIADYENLFPAAYAEFGAALQKSVVPEPAQGQVYANADTIDRRLLDLTGARFILASAAAPFLNTPDASYRLLMQEPGFRLYENLQVLPRAFVVHGVESVHSVTEAIQWLRAGHADLKTVAAIEQPFEPMAKNDITGAGEAAAKGATEEAAWFALYKPEYVVIDFEAMQSGFLILTDQFTSGWHARLDGQSAAIYRADGVFRAVQVEAGTHRLEFTYAPLSFRIGVAMSLVSLAVAALVLWRSW